MILILSSEGRGGEGGQGRAGEDRGGQERAGEGRGGQGRGDKQVPFSNNYLHFIKLCSVQLK